MIDVQTIRIILIIAAVIGGVLVFLEKEEKGTLLIIGIILLIAGVLGLLFTY